MASTYLTRAQASGNRRTVTFSAWVKRSALGDKNIFNGTNNSSEFTALYFTSADELFLYDWRGAEGMNIKTTQKFRDTSAWYHIVVAFDTTQATASNRVKIYVNGSQVTDFATSNYPAQNLDLMLNVNSSFTTKIGVYPTSNTLYFDGYMAHVHFTEGTQYAASDFGETDTNGQWKPIPSPSVTYGTNGFFLKFANSGSLGTDSSGNGNNFTVSGSGDQVTDTPDNVFATLNPLDLNSTASYSFSEGNVKTSNTNFTRSTFGHSVGKWYVESKCVSTACWNGVRQVGQDVNQEWSANSVSLFIGGATLYISGVSQGLGGYGSSWSANDIMMMALDLDSGTQKIYFGKNGGWWNGSDYSAGSPSTGVTLTSGLTWQFQFGSGSGTSTQEVNFGNPSFSITSGNTDDNGYGNFEYAPPSGYLALCTQNLATALSPTIDDGSQYFNTLLWTGDGTSPRSITGLGFQPDWVWYKQRSASNSHLLFDSIRGASDLLKSNETSAEATNTNTLKSFDADGFTIGSDGNTNGSGQTYVAWNWLANGGTTSSNTDGSITSTVQANTTAGFSIVTYTGTGSNATVGHGLGKTPKMIIWKRRDSATNWSVQGTQSGINTDQTEIVLNSTGAVSGVDSRLSRQSQWSSTTFEVNTYVDQNASGGTFVTYCFAEIEGYSKFGSYVANGNVDGTFAYTGFRPALVIIKQTNSSTGGYWFMFDSIRSTYNVIGDVPLAANANDAEGLGNNWNPNTPNSVIDFVSNGFKLRTTSTGGFNVNGNSYIYMAFAEHPFVDSTGRPVTAR